jgi:hypothetical protein
MNILLDENIKPKKSQKIEKIRATEYEIPIFSEYKKFISINYPVSFLKLIAKHYKLKQSGNKQLLKERIFNFLLQSTYCLIIQKHFRGHLLRTYHKCFGPALYNRSLCMNDTDFFTLENISEIPQNAFFSYKSGNNIWGFNIISIYNLFAKFSSNTDVLNPYTREKIDDQIFHKIRQLVYLNKLFKTPVNIIINNNNSDISNKKKLELRCLDLFQYMDELGNYTDCKWFLSLNRFQLIRLVRELTDIWEYRAQLSHEVKQEICYPYGNPFRYIDPNYTNLGFLSLQKMILSIIEQFIKKGINREMSNLGASFILCGLTLVNVDAAMALPWLYQSVSTA